MADEKKHDALPFTTEQLEALSHAFKDLRFGTVEITVHQGQITQIERRERQRFQTPLAVAALALLTFFAPIQRLWADDAADAPLSLQALDQRLKIAERKLETQNDDTTAAKKTVITVNADRNNGFSFYNPDKSWGLKLSGVFQVDERTWFLDNAKPQANAFLPRRGRFQVDANIGANAKVRFQEDFVSGSLVDAYGELKLLPWATLRTGLFKTPLSLERWRSDPARDLVELGYTTDFVTDRSTGAYLELADPDQIVTLGAGAFDSSPENTAIITTDTQDDKDVVAKLFSHPFRALDIVPLRDFGLGVAVAAGNRAAGTVVSGANQFRTTGQAAGVYTLNAGTTLEDGSLKLVPQAYLFWENFSLLGEYVHAAQFEKNAANTGYDKKALVNNEAWQAQFGWVLTGEDASFTGLKLNKDTSSRWGALQWVARAQGVTFDQESFSRYDGPGTVATSKRLVDPRVSVSGIQAWGVGLNYVPIDNVKLLINWEQSSFTDGASVTTSAGTQTANRETENVLLTRLQFTY